MACSTPPTYWSIGAQRLASAGSKACSSLLGDKKRRKYHEESKKVSIVSASRLAAPPHLGHVVFTQSSAAPRGDVPFGLRSSPSAGGSSIGRSSSGTGTSPQESQCTMGMGVPQ